MNINPLPSLIEQHLPPRVLRATFAKIVGQAVHEVREEERRSNLMPFDDGADPTAIRFRHLLEVVEGSGGTRDLNAQLRKWMPYPYPFDGESIFSLAATLAADAVRDIDRFSLKLQQALSTAKSASRAVTFAYLPSELRYNPDISVTAIRQSDAPGWASIIVGREVWTNGHCRIFIDSIVEAMRRRPDPAFVGEAVRLRMEMLGLGGPSLEAFDQFKSLGRMMRWLFPHCSGPAEFQEIYMPTMRKVFAGFFGGSSGTLPRRSLRSRVRRALELLLVAGQTKNAAVSAALCVGAADALVASKDAIHESLKRRISCILEPEAALRPAAEGWVSKAWKHRNDVFHNGRFDLDHRLLIEARRLAAGLLLALLDQVEHPGSDDPDAFFAAVDAHTTDGYVGNVRGSALFPPPWR